jgi:hypothetical protein
MTAVELMELAVEAYLSELPDDEFAALTRRVRPPKAERYPAKPRTGKRRTMSAEANRGD